MAEWKQERPAWCPHADCKFLRRAMDSVCGGELPAPVLHDGDVNTHRLCLREPTGQPALYDLQVNSSDLGWLRWILDALDGKRTSWMSQLDEGEER